MLIRLVFLFLLLLISNKAHSAFTEIGSGGSAQDRTSSTSLAITPTVTLEAGNLVICVVATNNNTTTDGNSSDVTSVTDSASNTWTKAREYTNGQGAADAGATVAIFYSVLTTQLTTSSTVTVNFGFTSTGKAAQLREFTIGAGNTISIDGTSDAAADSLDLPSMSATGTDSGEHLWVRASAQETGGSSNITPTSGWSAWDAVQTSGGGGGGANMGSRAEHKIATGTGSGTSDPTMGGSDNASTLVGLIEVASSTPTPTNTPAATNTPTATPTVTPTPSVRLVDIIMPVGEIPIPR